MWPQSQYTWMRTKFRSTFQICYKTCIILSPFNYRLALQQYKKYNIKQSPLECSKQQQKAKKIKKTVQFSKECFCQICFLKQSIKPKNRFSSKSSTNNGKMIPRNDKTVVRPWKYCPYLPFTAPHYVARSRVPLPSVMSLSSFTF